MASGESPGSLLDIGCGTGEFMVEMKRAGWQVTGVEKDEKAAQVARSAGCKVIVDNPAEVDLPPSSFNLVTCWHSLEHLPDLSATVAKIAALIMPEGLLAVAVPNPASLDARFYGSRWAAWDAPRHLYHFRPGDLRKLLEPKGFRCIKSCSLPLDPFYHVLLSELRGASGGGAWLRVVRGLIIGFLSFIAGLKPERGSSTLYLFRKI